MFPGEGYSHFQTFRDRNVAFFDFPGLDLSTIRPTHDNRFKEKLARADALREWHLRGWEDGESRPSENLEDYEGSRFSARRKSYAASAERFYYDLPEGSVILVPGSGAYGPLMIGEIAGPRKNLKLQQYGDDLVPARPMRWLATPSKRVFTADLRDRLALPIPLIQLDKSLYGEILNQAYPNYSLGGEYVVRFNTTEANFDSLDDFDIQYFVNFVAGVLVKAESGEVEAHSVKLVDAIAALRGKPELIPELASNINSPGYLRYVTQDISSLAIAVMLSVALSSPASGKAKVKVVNSVASKSDPCAYKVDALVNQAYQIVDEPGLHAACEYLKSTHKKTGINSSVHISPRGAKRG